MKRCFVLLALIVLLAGCGDKDKSKPAAITVSMSTSSSDGVFLGDQLLQVYATVKNETADKMECTIRWKIETDEQVPLKDVTLPLWLDPGQQKRAYCPVYELPGPGWYKARCKITTKDGATFVADTGIGKDPTKIMRPLTKEADFDVFWKDAFRELKSIEPEYKVIIQPDKCSEGRDIYRVDFKSLGGLKVYGWLEVPKKPGKYPGMLILPGYTWPLDPYDKYDDMVVLSFNPRSHGDSDEVPGAPAEMWTRGLDDKQTYAYRGLFMDCIRAMDFLAEQPKVDLEKIAVWGGSQGGGLTFMMVGLDDRAAVCVADVPWLCDLNGYLKTSHWDEIDVWLAGDDSRNWNDMLRTFSYFDTMNMADKITCDVLMAVGLQDGVCPPATSFATYNRINAKKEYKVYPTKGHDLWPEHGDYGIAWIRGRFGMK